MSEIPLLETKTPGEARAARIWSGIEEAKRELAAEQQKAREHRAAGRQGDAKAKP